MSKVVDFLAVHKETRTREIMDRINIDFEEDGSNSAWMRALRKYAEEIYEDRQSRRKR